MADHNMARLYGFGPSNALMFSSAHATEGGGRASRS
jgi:hypothetical protein